MATKGKNGWSGAIIGALVFTKIVMAPIALCSVLIFLWKSKGTGKEKLLALGMAIALSAGLAALLARGELNGFLRTLYLNLNYSQGYLVSGDNFAQKMVSHLSRLADWRSITVLGATCGCLVAAWFRSDQKCMPLTFAATASFCGSLTVLAMTALWSQHNQILYVPAVLSLAALAVTNIQVRATIGLAATLLFAWGLGGLRNPNSYVGAIYQFPLNWTLLNRVPLETAAMLANSQPSAYARLGQNDDGGHAIGLGRWKLACPKFHQYAFDPTASFDQVLSCLNSVDTVLVSESFIPEQGQHRWNNFVRRAEAILRSQFVCKQVGPLRVCHRR